MSKITQAQIDLCAQQSDPELIAALDVWGQSPNLAKSRGEDLKGFNAGVVHYFEYRSSLKEAGRYREGSGYDFSINGFIRFSQKISEIVSNPDVCTELRAYSLFKDPEAQERLILCTQDLFIVSVKYTGQKHRVITAIPDPELKRLGKNYTSVVAGEPTRSGRLNEIGLPRELVKQIGAA